MGPRSGVAPEPRPPPEPRPLRYVPALLPCLVILLAAAAPAQRGIADALPEDAVLAVSIGDVGQAAEALRRSRLLVERPRPGRPASEGRGAATEPLRLAATAIAHSCDWAFDEGVETCLLRRLARGNGPVAFGLVPTGAGVAVPVVVIAGTAEPDVDAGAASGLVVRAVGAHTIVTTDPAALDRIVPRVRALPGRVDADAALAVRVDVDRLARYRPAAGRPILSVVRHLAGSLPDRIELDVRDGAETLRLFGPSLGAGWRPIDAPEIDVRLDRLRIAYRLSLRVALPAGLGAIADRLRANPLGVTATLVRAWPGAVPAAAVCGRHLTGRAHVIVLESSQGLVPIVGLQLANARRGGAAVEEALLATGAANRTARDASASVYARRRPHNDRALKMLERRHGMRQRRYRVLQRDDWLWLGPRDEIRELGKALDHKGQRSRPSTPAERDAHGRLVVDAGHFWSTVLFQHQELTGVYLAPEELAMLEAPSTAMRNTGLMRYRIEPMEGGIALRRDVPMERSLLPIVAARAVLAARAVRHLERRVGATVRTTLAALRRAQLHCHERTGAYATSVEALRDGGYWRPGESESSVYDFAVRATGAEGFTLVAVPRDRGPLGWRPTVVMDAAGRLTIASDR